MAARPRSGAARAESPISPPGRALRWRGVWIGLLAAVTGFSGTPDAGAGRTPAPRVRAVRDYAAALDRVLRSRGTAPVESLFSLGTRAAESLLVVPTPGGPSLLEALDDSTFLDAQSRMRGFNLWRDEVVVAAPEPSFFLHLARSRGDAADTAFFHALSLTYGPGVSPVYVEQQTDYSGCTDFGSGRLVSTFEIWNTFVSSHPRRYEAWSRKELQGTEDELTAGTCACGGREAVFQELSSFVRRFPSAAGTPRVRARLKAIGRGTSGIRYRCKSG